MRKLAVRVQADKQWAKDHPNGKATRDGNEDAGDS
jgi:hypothetical protein